MTLSDDRLPRPAAPDWLQRLWRGWLALRFQLFQRHRHNRLVLERVAGMPLLVLPGVFNPALFFSSAFLARYLQRHPPAPGAAVLEIGPGTGLLSLTAAAGGAALVAVEINPDAARCTRINAVLNRLEQRVTVLEGDLFSPLEGRRFDLVLINPPYFRGAPTSPAAHAWRSTDLPERFAVGLAEHLRPGGAALAVLSTNSDLSGFLAAFAAARLSVELAARRDLISEVLLIYRLRPPTNTGPDPHAGAG